MLQQHDHIVLSSSQGSETNGTAIGNTTTTHVHQREWELGSVNGGAKANHCKEAKVSDNNVLVIMAGNDRPTFLATPMYCAG